MNRGLFLTLQAIRRQLAAMPNEIYLVRLIHHPTRRAFPGERLWTASDLSSGPAVGFLRMRNREGCDIYIHPYAGDRNAGYILLDLDRPDPNIVPTMRVNGHQPCVLLQTSPGHLQAWIQVSPTPLQPATATEIGRQLARLYGGDLASTDWRHLGRLAGFTNQKPTRRQPSGYAPWVKVLHAQSALAFHGASLVQAAQHHLSLIAPRPQQTLPSHHHLDSGPHPISTCWQATGSSLTPAAAAGIYAACMNRLRILQRFSPPDWSIADLWIAKHLLFCRIPTDQVLTVLRLGSPGFPRRYSNPADYLHRTLTRVARELQLSPFPAGHLTPRRFHPPASSNPPVSQ